MKIASTIILIIFCPSLFSQVKIHAHNDYEKPYPLTNALHNKVFSVEADVFLRGTVLVVAHSPDQINPNKTLTGLYIKPMVSLFQKNRGYISADTAYKVSLVIDIKEKGDLVLKNLEKLLQQYRKFFDRSVNPHAVQVIISGDRGAITNWKAYPGYMFFDGRPTEEYDAGTLKKVAVISDSYQNYARPDTLEIPEKLQTVIEHAHQEGKLLRLWGTPDNERGWAFFSKAGIDIINTDKVDECRAFFEAKR
jgi:hypothetical protein